MGRKYEKNNITWLLLLMNCFIWSIALIFIFQTLIFHHYFLRNNEQLVQEISSYQSYSEYISRKEYLSKRMTPTVLNQVCPIIQVDDQKNEASISVTNVKTENYSFKKSSIAIIVSFDLQTSISGSQRKIKMIQTYKKEQNKWLLSQYNYV